MRTEEQQNRQEIRTGMARAIEIAAKARTHESGIGDVTEGPIVDSLVYVFRQLEQMGFRRAEG